MVIRALIQFWLRRFIIRFRETEVTHGRFEYNISKAILYYI